MSHKVLGCNHKPVALACSHLHSKHCYYASCRPLNRTAQLLWQHTYPHHHQERTD
jgi:hypothetical protein